MARVIDNAFFRNRSQKAFAWVRSNISGSFDSEDLSSGTLILNFVDPPQSSLNMDFAAGTYSQWASDPSTPNLVGYYQVKG